MKKNISSIIISSLLLFSTMCSTSFAFDPQSFLNKAKDAVNQASQMTSPSTYTSPSNYTHNEVIKNVAKKLSGGEIEVFDTKSKALINSFTPGMSVSLAVYAKNNKTFEQAFNTTDKPADMQKIRVNVAIYDGDKKLGDSDEYVKDVAKEKETSFRIWVDPTDKTIEPWEETVNLRNRVFAIKEDTYYKLAPKVYTVKFEVYYEYGNIDEVASTSIKWDLSGQNFAKWQNLASLINKSEYNAVIPDKAGQKNPKLEAEIKALMAYEGIVKRVILIDSDWTIHRNEYGIITYRILTAEVIYKQPDGHFLLSERNIVQDYLGNNMWAKTRLGSAGWKQEYMSEDNIWK